MSRPARPSSALGLNGWARRLMILAVLLASPAIADELIEVAAKVKPAVVKIIVHDELGAPEGLGTGFYVSATGRLVTNHHVIEHGARLTAISPDGTERKVVGVLATDEDRDLVLLQVEGATPAFLALGSSEGLVDGTKVNVYGSPLGLSWTLSSGIISGTSFERTATKPSGQQRQLGRTLQVSASMMGQGNSGSPVFNNEGAVLGVIYSGIGESGGIGFAIPVEAVAQLVAGAAAAPVNLDETQGTSLSARTRNLGISAVFFLGIAGWGAFQLIRRRKAPPSRRSF